MIIVIDISAAASVSGFAFVETYASIAWVRASIPVAAVRAGGIPTIRFGSLIAICGVTRQSTIAIFTCRLVSVMIQKRVISEAVPAVVLTAIIGHNGDIGSAAPKRFPESFFKMADTLIGPGDEIQLPKLKEAQKTTAETELGIIMGKDCRDVSEENWQDAIVGYTTILDMTEESILKENDYISGNPRYLTIVKNFPTFFSFGPQLVTPDDVPDVLCKQLREYRGRMQTAERVC